MVPIQRTMEMLNISALHVLKFSPWPSQIRYGYATNVPVAFRTRKLRTRRTDGAYLYVVITLDQDRICVAQLMLPLFGQQLDFTAVHVTLRAPSSEPVSSPHPFAFTPAQSRISSIFLIIELCIGVRAKASTENYVHT